MLRIRFILIRLRIRFVETQIPPNIEKIPIFLMFFFPSDYTKMIYLHKNIENIDKTKKILVTIFYV